MDKHVNHFPLRYLLQPKTLRRRLKYHAVFWLVFMVFHLLYFAGSKEKIHYETSWVIAYALYYLRFIPVYYLSAGVFNHLKEKYYGGSLMVLSGIFMVLLMHTTTVSVYFVLDQQYGLGSLSENFLHFGTMYLRPPGQNQADDWLMLLIYDVTETQILFLPLGLKMFQYGVQQLIQKRDLVIKQRALEADILKNELVILRTQSAPHLVFNVLNSVLSDLLKVSKKASGYLINLSDVLRFILYKTDQELIPLQSEWHALLHFMDLEAKRFNDRLKVNVRQKGKISPDHLVPTLVLFTLADNAFKHGVYSTFEDCWIDVELRVKAGRLLFIIANNKPAVFIKPKNQRDSGIGLDNIKKRLEISAQGQYSLTATENEKHFSITLDLPLISPAVPLKAP